MKCAKATVPTGVLQLLISDATAKPKRERMERLTAYWCSLLGWDQDLCGPFRRTPVHIAWLT